MINSKKVIIVIASILFLGVVVIIILSFKTDKVLKNNTPTTNSVAVPTISWGPNSINRSIPQGEKKSVVAIFASNEDLKKVETWITPELKPYLTVSPANFENINKNSGYTLTLNFSIPIDASVAVYKGTLHIRNADNNSNTYSNALPINLEITPAGSDYVEPIGMPTPKETLAYAARAIENGDTKDALKMFYKAAHNKIRDSLNQLDLIARKDLAHSIGIATLDKNAESPNTGTFKTYTTQIQRYTPQRSLITTHFHMVTLPNGNWVILNL